VTKEGDASVSIGEKVAEAAGKAAAGAQAAAAA
jgi:hypothetical protein